MASEQAVNPEVDPRVARTRAVVVAAAVAELVEVGFERVSIDAIAERSGVARSTIYRNWKDRTTLLAEAFGRVCAAGPADIAPSNSLRHDLEALGRLLIAQLTSEDWSRTVPSLISAAVHDRSLQGLLADFGAERGGQAQRILARAVERGELIEGPGYGGAMERFVAPFFFRRLMTRLPLDESFLQGQVDATMQQLGDPGLPLSKP